MDAYLIKVSEGKNISKWPRNNSYEMMVKTLAAFCPFPKYLSEAKLKYFELMSLTAEISRKPSIGCVTWLLVMILLQIYNKMATV